MSNIEGWQTPGGWELPKKQELTIEDLLAEVRAPRPWEEADLEAPIVAEWTAGKVARLQR